MRNGRLLRNNTGAAKNANGALVHFGHPGAPDLTGILGGSDICPHCDRVVRHQRGQWIGLELKTDTGIISPAQKKYRAMIEKYGGKIAVVRSLEDAREIMRFWGAEWE